MKKIFKILLKYYLKYITKLALLVHRPTIVAVAGSTNKSFVKKEIKKTLEKKDLKVRANPKNFNTEIGLPLAILYLPSGYNEYRKWLPVIFKAPLKIFQKNFPSCLILELGTSDAGDMKYLLSLVKPRISIVTNITQRYLEGYNDMNEMVKEFALLAAKTSNLLILNNDNNRVRELASRAQAKIIKFGEKDDSDYKIKDIKKEKKGQTFILKNKKKNRDIELNKFGKHHIHAHTISFIIKDYFNGQKKF